MTTYAYRLGWRSLKVVLGRRDLTNDDYRQLARDLGQAMVDYQINTTKRAAMFIAQVAHESGGFRYRQELADGSAYEGRRDLGNVRRGDGKRFKGRSYIQITGRTNYREVSDALDYDFIEHPEALAEPRFAAEAAAWWWKTHGCNQLADSGDFIAVTKRINGGTNGLADRQWYYKRARPVARFLVPKRRKP
jgi:putative chitinase